MKKSVIRKIDPSSMKGGGFSYGMEPTCKTFNSTKDYSHGFDDVEYTINVKLVAQNV
mgnify:CR=1 FL=1